jgi:hypothetical protein
MYLGIGLKVKKKSGEEGSRTGGFFKSGYAGVIDRNTRKVELWGPLA